MVLDLCDDFSESEVVLTLQRVFKLNDTHVLKSMYATAALNNWHVKTKHT